MYRMLSRMPLAENNEIRPVFVVTTNHRAPYKKECWNIDTKKKIKCEKMKINFAIKNHFKIAYFGRKLIKNGLHI